MKCKHDGITWYLFNPLRLRCYQCGLVSLGPSNDEPDEVQDELIAIEVAAFERAFIGETSGVFRIGFHGDRDASSSATPTCGGSRSSPEPAGM